MTYDNKSGNGNRSWLRDNALQVATLLVAAAGFAFSTGIYYNTTLRLKDDFDTHLQAESQDYIRRDVAEQQLQHIKDELVRLQSQVDDLTRLLISEQVARRRSGGLP